MAPNTADNTPLGLFNAPFERNATERYSRTLLVPEIGVHGQKRLCHSSVLVVGAGGLGSPALLYLAAAGVGTLGIVDHDIVEIANLQRQIIHSTSTVGIPKVLSAQESIKKLAPECTVHVHHCLIDATCALDIIRPYDVVLDCTDNAATRYLLNDTCVLLGIPLVSGSALRLDGQLTTYHGPRQGVSPSKRGPCYRCLFPTPPPASAVTNCSDGGVLGVVPGIIGTMQALEAIKIAAGLEPSYVGKMLIFSGLSATYRTAKLRTRSSTCKVCGDNPTITAPIDYVQFCGSAPNDAPKKLRLLPDDSRWTPETYRNTLQLRTSNNANGENNTTLQDHILLDVRPSLQFAITHIPGAINIPRPDLVTEQGLETIRCLIQRLQNNSDDGDNEHSKSLPKVVVVCRRGNESQRATIFLRENGMNAVDIIGGIEAYAAKLEPNMPTY